MTTSDRNGVSRRDFVRWGAFSGAALALGITKSGRVIAAPVERAAAPFAPSQWITIDDTGKVTIVAPRSEMGQGVRTAIPMIVADELGADWARVTVVHATPGPQFDDMRTSGSSSVADVWIPLRQVAAAARAMLISAAADAWRVNADECRAQHNAVVHLPTNRRVEFGALVAAASARPIPTNASLKPAAELTLLGTRVARVDGPAIVRGEARFGIDVRVPGMRFAAIARPPQLGASVLRWDAARARAVPGVSEIVEVPSGVAVIADRTWAAIRGRDALTVEWKEPPNERLNTRAYKQALESALPRAKQARREGDIDALFTSAAKTMQATYGAPFHAHATMEPPNCVAHVHDGRCELWVGTQAPNEAQKETAQLLGISPDRVTVNVQLLGGGFGRRLTNDYVLEAVEVARKVRSPVQVVWTRQDDLHHDIYQPAQVNRLSAALDTTGHPVAWRHETADYHLTMFGPYNPNEEPDGVPWGGVDTPYAFRGIHVTFAQLESPVPSGAWRSVAYPAAVFARESFLDEVAHASGRDPVALRMSVIPSPGNITRGGQTRANGDRLREVVRLAAEKSNWTDPFQRERDGRHWGRGIACNSYHGATMVAQVAEVSVGARGDIRVHRVVCAVDCGQVINLSGLEGQFESGVIWALSSLLKGEITFERGRVEQSNFGDYPVVRMSESPVVEVHVVKSALRPFGVGEQPVPAVWPAVANAVFAATGQRLRSVPLSLR